MPLETATYLTDLVSANPGHSDGLSQADSHMRLIKSTLKATFPNFTAAALSSSQAQIDAAVAGTVTGAGSARFALGTAALPGITPTGDTNTGLWSPAADQLAFSLNGVQVLLMGGSSLVTSLGVAAAAIASTGAYSGGTGQLVPIGAVLEWYDDVLPAEGGYAWANGQIIASANTVCPVLLARWGARFGGNGTTTMGVPDRRDTVGVGKSTMGGVASRALQTLTNTTLGALFGEANHTLTSTEMPSHFHSAVIFDPLHAHVQVVGSGTGSGGGGAFGVINATGGAATTSSAATGVRVNSSNGLDATYSAGGGATHNNVQPSTTCNYIIRLG